MPVSPQSPATVPSELPSCVTPSRYPWVRARWCRLTRRLGHDGRMHLREQISYDAPIADVFAMLCTQKFRDQVCEEMRALRYEVTITAVAETATIRVSRVLP